MHGVTCFNAFFGFLQLATAYTPKRISTKNTSKDVIPTKDVPFGGPGNYIWYLDPSVSEKPPFWDRFWLDVFFATENRFNMGMLQYKTTINRRHSPIKGA